MRSAPCLAMLAVCFIALQCTANGEVASSAAEPSLSEVPSLPSPPSGSPLGQTAHSGLGGTGGETDLSVGPAAAPVTTTTTTAAKPEHKPQLEEPSAGQTQQEPQQPQEPHGPSNKPNNPVEELEREDEKTEIQHGAPNQSNKTPPPPEPHQGQKKDTVQDTAKEEPRPPLQTTRNATVAAGGVPDNGNSASSKDLKAPADKHPEAPSQVNDARDTNVNLPKAQALPDTNNVDNPVVEETTQALNKPEVPTVEAPTDLTKGKAASEIPSGKSTPASPKENDPTHSQPLTVSSSGDKGPSPGITPPKKRVVTSPSPPEKKETPQSAPSGGEQPQPPAQGLPTFKSKAAVNGTTHRRIAAAQTDKNQVPSHKPEPLTLAAADDAVHQTATNTENKETHTAQTSITSTAKPVKGEHTLSANHSQKLSKALQALDKTDNSIGGSSLFAFSALITFIVMSVAAAC